MCYLKSKFSDDWKETYPWLYRVDGDPYPLNSVFLIVSIAEQLSI